MNYVPIRVSTLRGDQKTLFDIYVPIGDRFVLYIRRGDSFEGARLDRLKQKKVKRLYILPSEEKLYRKYIEGNLNIAFDPESKTSMKNRAEIIHGIQESHIEDIFENPDNIEAYQDAGKTSEKYIEFILNEDGALKEMLSFENLDKSLTHHCVSVATLSISLANKLGTVDKKLYKHLALGALLHDLGHYLSDLDIARPLKELTPEEMNIYKEHPKTAGQFLREKDHFHERVLNIITQHHEHRQGSGFPNKLVEKYIDPLALIVSSCDCYDRLISYNGLGHAEALKTLMIGNIGDYPLEHLNAIGEIVKPLI